MLKPLVGYAQSIAPGAGQRYCCAKTVEHKCSLGMDPWSNQSIHTAGVTASFGDLNVITVGDASGLARSG